MAYEQPSYRVLETTDDYEIREYGDRLVVQTEADSSSEAFRRLFRYISGHNTASEKVSMTVPVAQGTKIDMTVPVSEGKSGGSSYMQFFLPHGYSLETAPKPSDPNVYLELKPGGEFAVLTYRGRLSWRTFEKKVQSLRNALEKDGRRFTDQPIRATYNGPLTPFFLRRNEVMFALEG